MTVGDRARHDREPAAALRQRQPDRVGDGDRGRAGAVHLFHGGLLVGPRHRARHPAAAVVAGRRRVLASLRAAARRAGGLGEPAQEPGEAMLRVPQERVPAGVLGAAGALPAPPPALRRQLRPHHQPVLPAQRPPARHLPQREHVLRPPQAPRHRRAPAQDRHLSL